MNTNVFGPPNLIEMKVVLSHLECDLGLFWVQDTKPLFKWGTPQRSFIMLGWLGPKPQPLSLSLQSRHSIQGCVNPHRTNYITSLWVFLPSVTVFATFVGTWRAGQGERWVRRRGIGRTLILSRLGAWVTDRPSPVSLPLSLSLCPYPPLPYLL